MALEWIGEVMDFAIYWIYSRNTSSCLGLIEGSCAGLVNERGKGEEGPYLLCWTAICFFPSPLARGWGGGGRIIHVMGIQNTMQGATMLKELPCSNN